MIELHLPWLELAILMPLLGAAWVICLRDPVQAQQHSVIFFSLALLFSLGAWIDFVQLHSFDAHDHFDLITPILGPDVVVVDELSAPLLPLVSLLFFLTSVVTMRTKVRRFPFATTLLSEAVVLATFSCKDVTGIVLLLMMGLVPTAWELRCREKPTRVFIMHMSVFAGFLMLGWAGWMFGPTSMRPIALACLSLGVLIRSGIAPVHCWMTDLFEHATLGTALLFVTPMVGAYGVVRLVFPYAPDWALQSIGLLSMLTSLYAAGMALVQTETRRFFCYLFLSHSSLVLVALETVTPIGLTGALALWLSIGLSLGGLGLTLRALEARVGRVSLTHNHGLYDQMPTLAGFFLLTGLGSIGFPGTLGFIGMELLIEGATQTYPYIGMIVVLTAALNGIGIVQTYFRVFGGQPYSAAICLRIRSWERVAVLALAALIIGGGLFPQLTAHSRYHAAQEIIKRRDVVGDPELANWWEIPSSDSPKAVMLPSTDTSCKAN